MEATKEASPITKTFNESEIRIVENDGEPWFVAKDVCDALGLTDPSKTLERLDPDEKGTNTIRTPGGAQKMAAINEAGVYRLIFTSRKPEAEAFKRWLAHDVLPEIRKTGSYQAEHHAGPERAFNVTFENGAKHNIRHRVMSGKTLVNVSDVARAMGYEKNLFPSCVKEDQQSAIDFGISGEPPESKWIERGDLAKWVKRSTAKNAESFASSYPRMIDEQYGQAVPATRQIEEKSGGDLEGAPYHAWPHEKKLHHIRQGVRAYAATLAATSRGDNRDAIAWSELYRKFERKGGENLMNKYTGSTIKNISGSEATGLLYIIDNHM